MGAASRIEWCDATFNPWRGCTKVSAGCANCYAERDSKRNPAVLGEWGPSGKRVIAAENYWRQPFSWDRAAAKAGVRKRVFCASLADVFEDRPELEEPRLRLLGIILATPNLDWLLLTKRPEHARDVIRSLDPSTERGRGLWDRARGPVWSMLSGARREWYGVMRAHFPWPLPNVWLGVSVEDQATADERIPHLLATPAAVRFLSVEPLLGPVDLSPWLQKLTSYHFQADVEGMLRNRSFDGLQHDDGRPMSRKDAEDALYALHAKGVKLVPVEGCEGFSDQTGCPGHAEPRVSWVIVGGESGPRARPMHPEWLFSLRDQCVSAGVPFFFKQWGEFVYRETWGESTGRPKHIFDGGCWVERVGKKEAGRLLDGREWNEMPAAPAGSALPAPGRSA